MNACERGSAKPEKHSAWYLVRSPGIKMSKLGQGAGRDRSGPSYSSSASPHLIPPPHPPVSAAALPRSRTRAWHLFAHLMDTRAPRRSVIASPSATKGCLHSLLEHEILDTN